MTSPQDLTNDPRSSRTQRPRGNDNPTLPTPQRSSSGRPTPRPTTPPAPTYVFGGKYELLEELGSGGMGVVFHGRDMRLKRDVAIKLVDLGPRPSASMIERFEREARTTARLRHPAIVPVHDFGEFNGRHFLVMDFVHGKSLGERIGKGDLPLRDAVEVVRAVAEGIAYAHAQGILHRDLKPDNVLVDPSGKGYVTDFGLAKEIGSRSGLTKTGMAIGTAVYMSPEAAAGETKNFGPWTDVYGLGAILYEVLAGRPPFAGDSTVQIIASVMLEDPVPPSQVRAGVPRDLEVVCLKAMEKEPARRYPSAKEFADELGRWLDGEPIRARPMGTMATILRRIRRQRPWLAGVAALLALAVGALGVVVWEGRKEKARREEAASFFQQGLGRSQSSGGLREAIGLFDRALAIRPDYPEALLQRGIVHLSLGDTKAAARDLERATELNPTLADAWYHLGRAAAQDPLRGTRAKSAFRKLLDLAPSYRLAPIARARLAYLEGDLDGAMRLCGEAEKALGNDEEIHFLRGAIASKQGDSRAAIEHYTKGLEVRPESWNCLVNRACEHMALGELDRAMADLDRAIQINPDGLEAWANRAFCLIDLGRIPEAEEAIARIETLPPSPKNPKGLVRAQLLEAQKRHAEALAAIETVLAENPLDARALVVRARVHREMGRLSAAIDDLERAVVAEPHDGGARCMLAECLLEARNVDEALQHLAVVLGRKPDLPSALLLRSRAMLARSDRAAARADLERARAIAPADEEIAFALGQLLMDDGEAEAARRVFEDILARHPDSCEAKMSLGLMEIESGRLRGGFRRLGEVVAAHPDNATILANVGAILTKLGVDGMGAEFLDRAVERDPRCDLALQNRGHLRMGSGNLDGAIADYEAAIKYASHPAAARRGLAEALWKKGKARRALEEIERAVKEDPQVLNARTSRALILAANGKLDRAAAEADELLRRDATDARLFLVRAEQRIASGQLEAAAEDLVAAISAARDENALIPAGAFDLPDADWSRIEGAVSALEGSPELEAVARIAMGAFRLARGRAEDARAVLIEVVDAAPDDTGAIGLLVQAYIHLGRFAEAADLLESCAARVQDPDEARVIQLWLEQLAPLRTQPATRDDRLRRLDALIFWQQFDQVVRECSRAISEIERNPTGTGVEQLHLGQFHLAHATSSTLLATRAADLKEHQACWTAATSHLKRAMELGAVKVDSLEEDSILQLLLIELPLPR